MSGSLVTSMPTGGEGWRSRTQTVLSRTSFLHNSPEMSDVQFIFKNNEDNETTVFGHKFILAMASPVFNRMFFPQNPKFTITGKVNMSHHSFTPEAFLTFTKFLYTDKINYEAYAYEGLSMENIVGILECADYYDVPYLKMDCVKQLEKILTTKNVIQVLETAVLFKAFDLSVLAFKLVYQNLKIVFESEEILSAKIGTMLSIFKSNCLDIDECFVLDLALKWAKHECNRKNVEPTVGNKRKVLGEVFFEIRFALLTADRISELVSDGFLTLKESVDMFLAAHRSVRDPSITTAGSNFKRLCPEVSFKSNPRSFGRKLELIEISRMEAKWKETNKIEVEYWKSLAKVQANLCMRGFFRGESEEGLKNYIFRAGFLDIHVHRIMRGIGGAFHVQFLYNPCVTKEADLLEPGCYQLVDEIEITNWVEP